MFTYKRHLVLNFKIIFISFLINSAFAAGPTEKLKNFELIDFQTGKLTTLSEVGKYKDEKEGRKVFLNFWASWCTACVKELAELEELKKKYPDVLFIGVNAGDTKKKIQRFLKKYKFSFQILMDKNKEYLKSIGINEIPISIVLNSRGEVVYRSSKPPKSIE